MTAPAHRLPICLLVFLVVTWGTCPCVFATMLGLDGKDTVEAQDGTQAQSTAPC